MNGSECEVGPKGGAGRGRAEREGAAGDEAWVSGPAVSRLAAVASRSGSAASGCAGAGRGSGRLAATAGGAQAEAEAEAQVEAEAEAEAEAETDTSPQTSISNTTEIPSATTEPATELDARHLLCPLPVLRLRKALAALPSGATVALVATDPAAVLDVPHFCAQGGHHLLASGPLPDGARRYLVRRG